MEVLVAIAAAISLVLVRYVIEFSAGDRDPWPIFFYAALGGRVIWVDDNSGPPFKAVLRVDPWGKKYAYRYHSTRVGIVRLFDDGTAEYFGTARWIDVK